MCRLYLYLMRYVKCDIIEIAGPAAIVHICNDLGHWGAGFTKSLSKKWPQAEKAYRAWAKNKVDHDNNPFKLGQISTVRVGTYNIVNMIAQAGTVQHPAAWLPPIRYSALACAMARTAAFVKFNDLPIYAPKFGSGLAGGEWEVIENMIKEIWVYRNIDVTICYL